MHLVYNCAHLLKKAEKTELQLWAEKKSASCYICSRINILFPKYLDTTVTLYQKDPEFKKKYENCKGFCEQHLGMLLTAAQEKLNQENLKAFTETTVKLYCDNMARISEDLDWFAVKFDYRYKDAPWKNSKDAIERAIIKTNGILPKEKERT